MEIIKKVFGGLSNSSNSVARVVDTEPDDFIDSDSFLGKTPEEIFRHEIFPFLNVFELSRIECTCKNFQKLILSMKHSVVLSYETKKSLFTNHCSVEKAGKCSIPTEGWFKKYARITDFHIKMNNSYRFLHSEVIVKNFVTSCSDWVKSINLRNVEIKPEILDIIGKRLGGSLEYINLLGQTENLKEEDYFRFFKNCHKLTGISIGTRFSRRAGVFACFRPRFKVDSFSPFSDEHKTRFKKLSLWGLRVVHGTKKVDKEMMLLGPRGIFGHLAMKLVDGSEEELEELQICGIQWPEDVTEGLSIESLKRFPNLRKVRFSHSKMEVFFQHHIQLSSYEGNLTDIQLSSLIKTNHGTISKLIVYDKNPKNLNEDALPIKPTLKLSDLSISGLSKCVVLKDFRIIFPYYVGKYETHVTEECLMNSLKRMEETSFSKQALNSKDRLEVSYKDDKGRNMYKLFWDRFMDYDWDDM